MMKRLGIATVAFFLICTVGAVDLNLIVTEQAPPKEVSDTIRPLLSPKAIELVDGKKPVLQFWPLKEISLKTKPVSPAKGLDALSEATLIGVIVVRGSSLRDYRDNNLPEGVHTARFVLQPQDGDHLGSAEYTYFLALVGAAEDKEPGTFTKYGPLVKASGKQSSTGHPVVLSLRPVTAATETPSLSEPASEHKAIRLKIIGVSGGEKADVPFDLVYEGHGHIQ